MPQVINVVNDFNKHTYIYVLNENNAMAQHPFKSGILFKKKHHGFLIVPDREIELQLHSYDQISNPNVLFKPKYSR